MSYLALYRSDRWTLAADPAGLHVPAAELPRLRDALALALEVDTLAQSESARVHEATESGRAAGWAEGLRAGRAQAQAEAVERWSETLARLEGGAEQERLELRQALSDLALLVVRRVLVDLPPDEVLHGLVRRAIDQAEDGDAVTVRVHPEVKARLEAARPSGVRPIQYEADPHLDPWDCEVHTPTGRLLAGLNDQLARVQALLEQSLRQSAEATAREADLHAQGPA